MNVSCREKKTEKSLLNIMHRIFIYRAFQRYLWNRFGATGNGKNVKGRGLVGGHCPQMWDPRSISLFHPLDFPSDEKLFSANSFSTPYPWLSYITTDSRAAGPVSHDLEPCWETENFMQTILWITHEHTHTLVEHVHKLGYTCHKQYFSFKMIISGTCSSSRKLTQRLNFTYVSTEVYLSCHIKL